MKNSAEQIPAFIFDWLEQHSFEALTPGQQKEVLLYLTADAYRELHLAARSVKSAGIATQAPGKANRKQMLLDRFDSIHARPRPFVKRVGALLLWKAAAVFFFFVSGGIGFYALRHQGSPMVSVIRDTVYVNEAKASAPLKVYDTVYVYNQETGEQQKGAASPPLQVSRSRHYTSLPASDDIHVLSIEEMESLPNTPRGNSLKDDSIARKYKFITL